MQTAASWAELRDIKGLIFRFPPENPTAASVCCHLLSERKKRILICSMKASQYFISDELRMQGWWTWPLLEQTTDIADKERLPSFLQRCGGRALQSPQQVIPKRLALTCSGTFHTFYSLFFDDLPTVGPVLPDHKPICSRSGTLCTSLCQCVGDACVEMEIILFLVSTSVTRCDQSFHLQLRVTVFYWDLLSTLNRTGRCLWKGCELILTEYNTRLGSIFQGMLR